MTAPRRLRRSGLSHSGEKRKVLRKEASETADIVLFGHSIHSLTGYAGSLGARRLQWLLKTAPRNEAELRARGHAAVAELCETID